MSGLVSLRNVDQRSYDTVPCLPHSKGTVGHPDELPVWIRPVCIISCVNNWHASLVIRKWFSISPDKYAGIVTSKYPFTRVNSFRIKQLCNWSQKYYVVVAIENGRTVCFTVILLQSHENVHNVQKVRHFQTQQSFTEHALCCRARDLDVWEAVGRVPFDQRKFRKYEPVIFVEWKGPVCRSMLPFVLWPIRKKVTSSTLFLFPTPVRWLCWTISRRNHPFCVAEDEFCSG